ncbi:MAG: sigma 54-interacting transcriptional regulator [Desulfobacterales bacterium]|jgi:DNA-binding NtrC family response regulator
MTQEQHKIIILENNQQRRDALKAMLSELGHTPFIFEKESRCLDNLAPLNPDLVISGSLSADRAMRFINTLQLTKCGVPVIIISDDQNIWEFVDGNGFGDVCVLKVDSKPAEIASTITQVLQIKNGHQASQPYCPLIIGGSSEIVKIKKRINDLDNVNEAVLIQGERGTGKELMARYIHLKSRRHAGNFVKLDVPELPADFFEKQLLLLEDPAAKNQSLFAGVQHGTLLLEEIGSMLLESQTTFLKIIDEAGIRKADDDGRQVRIIATTSQDLFELIEKGQFRKALYFRLNVIRIDMPPLRSRLDDVPALTDFFTDKFCIESGRSHFQLSDQMKNLFACYHWPGNIQELEDVVKSIVMDSAEDRVAQKFRIHKKYSAITDTYKDINTLAGLHDIKKHLKDLNNISLKKISAIFLERAEKKLVKKALDSTSWNRKRAAKLLGISYKSLLNKIKEYKLN